MPLALMFFTLLIFHPLTPTQILSYKSSLILVVLRVGPHLSLLLQKLHCKWSLLNEVVLTVFHKCRENFFLTPQ